MSAMVILPNAAKMSGFTGAKGLGVSYQGVLAGADI